MTEGAEYDLEPMVRARLENLTEGVVPRTEGAGRAVLIGGQIASGKSTIQNSLQAAWPTRFVYYDGDQDAHWHPDLERIALQDPQYGYSKANSQFPEDLLPRVIAHLCAGDPRYDVVASHPLGLQKWADRWVNRFKEHGYHSTVVYTAVHEADSLIGIVDRHQSDRDSLGYGQWHAPDLHDSQYAAIPDIAHQFELRGSVDSLFVVNRDGAVLHGNHRDPHTGKMQAPLGAREAIIAERNRPPTPEEAANFQRKVTRLRNDELRHNGRPDELPAIVDDAAERYRQRPDPTTPRAPAIGAAAVPIGIALRSVEQAHKGRAPSTDRPKAITHEPHGKGPNGRQA